MIYRQYQCNTFWRDRHLAAKAQERAAQAKAAEEEQTAKAAEWESAWRKTHGLSCVLNSAAHNFVYRKGIVASSLIPSVPPSVTPGTLATAFALVLSLVAGVAAVVIVQAKANRDLAAVNRSLEQANERERDGSSPD